MAAAVVFGPRESTTTHSAMLAYANHLASTDAYKKGAAAEDGRTVEYFVHQEIDSCLNRAPPALRRAERVKRGFEVAKEDPEKYERVEQLVNKFNEVAHQFLDYRRDCQAKTAEHAEAEDDLEVLGDAELELMQEWPAGVPRELIDPVYESRLAQEKVIATIEKEMGQLDAEFTKLKVGRQELKEDILGKLKGFGFVEDSPGCEVEPPEEAEVDLSSLFMPEPGWG